MMDVVFQPDVHEVVIQKTTQVQEAKTSQNAVYGSLLNCQGSCINDRYSRLALYMAVLCLGQVGPLTNDR